MATVCKETTQLMLSHNDDPATMTERTFRRLYAALANKNINITDVLSQDSTVTEGKSFLSFDMIQDAQSHGRTGIPVHQIKSCNDRPHYTLDCTAMTKLSHQEATYHFTTNKHMKCSYGGSIFTTPDFIISITGFQLKYTIDVFFFTFINELLL